ncbi:unnamed protein product, partial [Mesorhabditis spiculigera]
MFRRLGTHQTAYRCESPSQSLSSLQSDCSIPISGTDPDPDFGEDIREQLTPVPPDFLPEERIVEKRELLASLQNVAKKLNTIVALINDFSLDALKMREKAEDLLEELNSRIRPSLIALDLEMITTERLLKYNVDRANIKEHRIDWLLVFNRYQKEMRRVLDELSGEVYDELENSLALRFRGVIGRRPAGETMENLNEMQSGMSRALQLFAAEA